jgi:hypothetical protein
MNDSFFLRNGIKINLEDAKDFNASDMLTDESLEEAIKSMQAWRDNLHQ